MYVCRTNVAPSVHYCWSGLDLFSCGSHASSCYISAQAAAIASMVIDMKTGLAEEREKLIIGCEEKNVGAG